MYRWISTCTMYRFSLLKTFVLRRSWGALKSLLIWIFILFFNFGSNICNSLNGFRSRIKKCHKWIWTLIVIEFENALKIILSCKFDFNKGGCLFLIVSIGETIFVWNRVYIPHAFERTHRFCIILMFSGQAWKVEIFQQKNVRSG